MGNLRTAILAWLFARSTGRTFLVRVEDLDRSRTGFAERQLADLAAVGLEWDGNPVLQTARRGLYQDAIVRLADAGLVYECFCTRAEIAEAPSAPHAPAGAYPGTCRNLTASERERRRRDRPAALRLRAGVAEFSITDQLHGAVTGAVDDFVLRRNDGVPAYNLAVVVDDAAQAVDQVVRGDDLLTSAPRQAYLASLLGLPSVDYAHVPLVLNTHHRRLAKRDGAVTLDSLRLAGWDTANVRDAMLRSTGLPAGPLDRALGAFSPEALSTEPWIFDPPETTPGG